MRMQTRARARARTRRYNKRNGDCVRAGGERQLNAELDVSQDIAKDIMKNNESIINSDNSPICVSTGVTHDEEEPKEERQHDDEHEQDVLSSRCPLSLMSVTAISKRPRGTIMQNNANIDNNQKYHVYDVSSSFSSSSSSAFSSTSINNNNNSYVTCATVASTCAKTITSTTTSTTTSGTANGKHSEGDGSVVDGVHSTDDDDDDDDKPTMPTTPATPVTPTDSSVKNKALQPMPMDNSVVVGNTIVNMDIADVRALRMARRRRQEEEYGDGVGLEVGLGLGLELGLGRSSGRGLGVNRGGMKRFESVENDENEGKQGKRYGGRRQYDSDYDDDEDYEMDKENVTSVCRNLNAEFDEIATTAGLI